MPNNASLLVKVFRIELEEIENDVGALLDTFAERFQNEEITNYVWQENRALLMKEISCIRELVKDLDNWSPPDNLEAVEILHSIRSFLIDIITARDYPGVVQVVVDRKLAKVEKYIE